MGQGPPPAARQPGPWWMQALCRGLGPAGGHGPEHGDPWLMATVLDSGPCLQALVSSFLPVGQAFPWPQGSGQGHMGHRSP